MDKVVNKSQMQTILDNRPDGVSMDDVIKAYTSNGYQVEGINYEKPKTLTENAKDLAIGFGKGVAKTGLDTAQNLQTIAQGGALVAGVSPQTVSDLSFDVLNENSPKGRVIEQKVLPANEMQKYGGYLETGAEILAGGGAGVLKDVAKAGGKALSKGAAPITSGTKALGKKVYESAFTPNVKEAENILAYEASQPSMFSSLFGAGAIKGNPAFKPVTSSETALRSGIAGTEKQVGVQAKRVADTLYKKEIAPAVQGIRGIISKDELFAPAEERIANMIDPSKKAAYQNALDSLREDYANISDFSFKDAQALKSELAQFTPAKVFRGQDVANETRMIQSDMANLIRQKTYEALKDVNIKQKYLDYGNLQELQKVGVRAISEAGTKGGFGGFWSTMYDKAMTPVKTIGGKALYKIGDKLEVTAPKGFEGKSFGDYLRSVGYLAPQVAEKALEQSFKTGTVPKTVNKTIDAFNKSTKVKDIGDFELGTFGINAYTRKQNNMDRFPESELDDTVKYISKSYKASTDSKNYRSDNIAHVAEMPNGEKRVIYTRINSKGKEEIINWHKVSNNKYIDDLSKNGTPSRN